MGGGGDEDGTVGMGEGVARSWHCSRVTSHDKGCLAEQHAGMSNGKLASVSHRPTADGSPKRLSRITCGRSFPFFPCVQEYEEIWKNLVKEKEPKEVGGGGLNKTKKIVNV